MEEGDVIIKANIELTTAAWKYAKSWVYSATYDEALSELHRFVIPNHDRLGIPGHVEVVAGHIGKIRNLGASSFNGMKHMDAAELRDVMSRGWGVGCHSWSHIMVMDAPERELLQSKEELERVIGRRVTIYTSPGSNLNLTPEIIKLAKQYGYIAGASITDDLNYSDSEDLFWLNRPPLHEKFSDLYDSAFDPFKRIHQAKKNNGWIIDYLHCPLEKAVHDYKDCSEAHHRERLETLAAEGVYDCWFANPDDVVDYRYMRRFAKINPAKDTCENNSENNPTSRFVISLDGLPEQVMSRELTFVLKSIYIPEALNIIVDGREVQAIPLGKSGMYFTASIQNNSEIAVSTKIPVC